MGFSQHYERAMQSGPFHSQKCRVTLFPTCRLDTDANAGKSGVQQLLPLLPLLINAVCKMHFALSRMPRKKSNTDII